MKKLIIILMLCALPLLSRQSGMSNQSSNDVSAIPDSVVAKVTAALVTQYGEAVRERAQKGVAQAARLWQPPDGSPADFEKFCLEHFLASDPDREAAFTIISKNYEVLRGHFNQITLTLREPLDTDTGTIRPIEHLFGAYHVNTHLKDDLFQNKIAFITVLNFPFYSLEEKKDLGSRWSGKEWAYARLGDLFIVRVPPDLQQKNIAANTDSDIYVYEYNIFMGCLLNNRGEKPFPKDLTLLSHWQLRNELRSLYSTPDNQALEKQRMIVEVMNRIISQEIPAQMINKGEVDWNPFQNKVFKDGKEMDFLPEPNTRYRHILNNFNTLKPMDAFYPPALNTYIRQYLTGNQEISFSEAEALYIRLLASPQVKQVAKLIRSRLNRHLEPFDIWYDRFRTRSSIPEEKLNAITKQKYPTAKAFEKDLANILMKLGFSKERATCLGSKIIVENARARGAGHSWPAQMKTEMVHLRSMVPAGGMTYEDYVRALHEFGHSVEQLISLHDVDHYLMSGIPNSAFTEALALSFDARALELLGMEENNPNKKHLEILGRFWSTYEMMGVSLVEMYMWKWLYEHPAASPEQLKAAVIRMAKEVWNKYYANVFGCKDQPILAIYSHMINVPLFLTAYCYGDLIDFQIEDYVTGKNLAAETERMFSAGRLIPQLWMKNAVGKDISLDPFLKATDEALKAVQE
ncbi:MAG: hypothetical protein ACM3SY_20380 [Candidatus Omnitrophota bacterium]